MFGFSEFGYASKELNAVFQATCFACIAGLLYGGVNRSRLALIDFMERNQASIFENHIDAKVSRNTYMKINILKTYPVLSKYK